MGNESQMVMSDESWKELMSFGKDNPKEATVIALFALAVFGLTNCFVAACNRYGSIKSKQLPTTTE